MKKKHKGEKNSVYKTNKNSYLIDLNNLVSK